MVVEFSVAFGDTFRDKFGDNFVTNFSDENVTKFIENFNKSPNSVTIYSKNVIRISLSINMVTNLVTNNVINVVTGLACLGVWETITTDRFHECNHST